MVKKHLLYMRQRLRKAALVQRNLEVYSAAGRRETMFRQGKPRV